MKAADFLRAPPAPDSVPSALALGEEEFLRSRVADALVRGREEDVDVVEGPGAGGETPFDLASFFDALRTPNLFGGARIVRVRRADKLISEHGEAVARFVLSGEAVHRLVLEATTSPPKDRGGRGKSASAALAALMNAVEKTGGVVVACDPPYDAPFGEGRPAWQSDLTKFVVAEAQDRGKRLRPEDAYRIQQLAGTGLRELAGEIAKLATFVGERPTISSEDVEAVVGASRASPAFDFGDAVAGADAKTALRLSHELFERGAEDFGGKRTTDPTSIAMMMVSAATSRVRKVGVALDLVRAGVPFESAAGSAGVAPFLRDRFRKQCEAWRGRDVAVAVEALAEAERGLKGGGGPPHVLVDRMVVALFLRGAAT